MPLNAVDGRPQVELSSVSLRMLATQRHPIKGHKLSQPSSYLLFAQLKSTSRGLEDSPA